MDFQPRSTAKRFVAIALASLFLLGACAPLAERDGYKVTGHVKLSPPIRYDIAHTLRLLYTEDVDIVIAKVQRDPENDSLEFTVATTLCGDMKEGDTHPLLPPFLVERDAEPREIEAPPLKEGETSKQILLFLRNEANGYRPLIDEASWLTVNIDTIVTSMDSVIPLSRAKYEIQKMSEDIILPASFSYYNDLEQLVANCTHIFIGTLIAKRDPVDSRFYVDSKTMRQSVSGLSQMLILRVDELIKSDTLANGGEIFVMNSEVMLDNTLRARSQTNVDIPYEDAPKLDVGQQSIFFVIDPPVGGPGAPKYFVNPIQGSVQIMRQPGGDDTTWPIYNNAVFSMPLLLNDLLYDIDAIMSGESAPFEYDASALAEEADDSGNNNP